MREWFQRAKCYNMDPQIFFPTGVTGRRPRKNSDEYIKRNRDEQEKTIARTICSSCDTVAECLEYALEHKLHGVAGAKSHEERLVILKRRRIA